jgi:3-hydroxyisobutyrate dehydrogenase-like beta-hydroxyacid dehydrogenase
MEQRTMHTAAILYPGEMGSAVGAMLVEGGWTVTTCVEDRSERTREGAQSAGITLLATLPEAVSASDLVVSLVPQDAVLETARRFAAVVRGGSDRPPVYLDANSVAPEAMARVAGVVSEVGADAVDGAFVGSSRALGQRTALYLSGPRAAAVAAALPASLHAKVVGTEIGLASAFKLAFAGFNKGLVALFLETAATGDAVGKKAELLECLRDFYPGTVETVERLLPSYPRHAHRRAQEMRELAEWLTETGREALMSGAAATVLERFAALGLSVDESASLEALLDDCRRRGFLSRPD